MSKTMIQTMREHADAFIRDHRNQFDNLVVARTDADEYLLSIELFCVPFSQCLCAENGVMFETLKKGQRITHIMHVEWEDDLPVSINIPCGACLERLLLFGDRVQVALLTDDDQVEFFEIRDLFPANWFSLALQNESVSLPNLADGRVNDIGSEPNNIDLEPKNDNIDDLDK